MMCGKLITLFFLGFHSILYCQDTIWVTEPKHLEYWVEEFDSLSQIWTQKLFNNDTLFSEEQLAADKFHPTGAYKGFFQDGTLAFVRNYFFDGVDSEIHGTKIVYYANGQLKERGNYHHSVKFGNWFYYNTDGTLNRRTQFIVPDIDTIHNVRTLQYQKTTIEADTILITKEEDTSYLDLFPCICFGKNGNEVIYESNQPIELRVYTLGKLVAVERRKGKIRRILRHELIQPDIILH